MSFNDEINQASVQKVLKVLIENDVDFDLKAFNDPARQATEAAALLKCPLGAIVKSLVFVKKSSNELFLVLVSGINRADLKKVGYILTDIVVPAPPDFVLSKTGYPVGAVPPLGINFLQPVIMDIELTHYQQVWASAGAENVLMGLSPMSIQMLTSAQLVHIAEDK